MCEQQSGAGRGDGGGINEDGSYIALWEDHLGATSCANLSMHYFDDPGLGDLAQIRDLDLLSRKANYNQR
jgi:hypothetical protein